MLFKLFKGKITLLSFNIIMLLSPNILCNDISLSSKALCNNSPYTLESIIGATQRLSDVPTLKQGFEQKATSSKKEWTLIIFVAADNDLRGFAVRNLQQMVTIGSSEHVNIIVHLDTRIKGNKKITRRFYVEKNNLIHVNADNATTQRMDSGDPQTLISCCEWGIKDYPADNYGLVLWNHGTGNIDPGYGKIINPIILFTLNEETNMLELDRSMNYFDFMIGRGICWDDSTGHYLSNQKLEYALKESCKLLPKKKFDFVGFDACLMQEVEIASYISNYATIMVGSQEVELGPGWHYQKVLEPFTHRTLTNTELTTHIVNMFDHVYSHITNDYTLSAINLTQSKRLDKTIDAIATLLVECLKNQKDGSVKKAISASRHRRVCTHFSMPDYIDLHHLCVNLQNNLKHFAFQNNLEGIKLIASLNKALEEGKFLIKQSVIANKTGKHLRNAQGISIYFPERNIHPSYEQLSFVKNNAWLPFLKLYLSV